MSKLFAQVSISAILFCTLFLLACEDPGSVSGGFLDDEANLQARNLPVEVIEPYSATSSYSGRLRYLAIGSYDDELFGSYSAIGLVRPSIAINDLDEIDPEDSLHLQLIFHSAIYGDTTSTTEFEIYPVEEAWRGNELRIGGELAIDESHLVASFSVTGNESVTVELDRDWVDEYSEWFSDEDEDLQNRYRSQFHGLAIVAAGNPSKVLFGSIQSGSDEEDHEENVRFILDRAGSENGSDEDGDETERHYIQVSDWGSLVMKGEPDMNLSDENLLVNNTLDQIVRLDPELNEERLGSRNLANVSLNFYQNNDLLESTLPSGHARPEISYIRIHMVDTDDVADYIFSRNPNFAAEYDEEEEKYRFDLTQYANNVLFGNGSQHDFYLSAETINGMVFSTVLYGHNAPEELRPEIVITSVNTTSE